MVCLSFAACDKGELLLDALPSDTSQSGLSSAPEDMRPSYSFAHAAAVYADPDAYKGKEYASPFLIVSEKQLLDGITVYYATGYINGSAMQTYTVLAFKDTQIPELTVNEPVYARGIIEGTGTLYDDDGNITEMLWLNVADIELDAGLAPVISTDPKKYSFGEGKLSVVNGSLSIEIISLDFSQDQLMLSTKTEDNAVDGFATYYFDIIIHQQGYFVWYHGCNYWINGGIPGYDNVPFPALNSAKDIMIEFVPYSEDGRLLYEPLVLNISLSGFE